MSLFKKSSPYKQYSNPGIVSEQPIPKQQYHNPVSEAPTDDFGRSMGQGTIVESEDIHKWEMDMDPHLDKIYHRLLGESETVDGTWERNPRLPRIMNEYGASMVIQEIRARANVNMQFSELDLQDIKHMCADVGRIFANNAFDMFVEWEVKANKSLLTSIGKQIVDQLYIFLQIAKNGGMKIHRERRGIKQYFNPQTGGEGVY